MFDVIPGDVNLMQKRLDEHEHIFTKNTEECQCKGNEQTLSKVVDSD